MTTDAYESISEIYRPDTGELVPPREDWTIYVVERDLEKDLGDVGGREPFIANTRVQVTEADGSTWTGVTRLG